MMLACEIGQDDTFYHGARSLILDIQYFANHHPWEGKAYDSNVFSSP